MAPSNTLIYTLVVLSLPSFYRLDDEVRQSESALDKDKDDQQAKYEPVQDNTVTGDAIDTGGGEDSETGGFHGTLTQEQMCILVYIFIYMNKGSTLLKLLSDLIND